MAALKSAVGGHHCLALQAELLETEQKVWSCIFFASHSCAVAVASRRVTPLKKHTHNRKNSKEKLSLLALI